MTQPTGPREFVALPPRFAMRIRVVSIPIGVMLIFCSLILFAIGLGPGTGSADQTATRVVMIALPALFVVATAVTLMTAARCLDGDRLIIAKARATSHVLLACLVGTAVTAVPIGFFLLLSADNVLPSMSIMVLAFIGVMGYGLGMFFVRPSVGTLRRFAKTEEGSAW